MVCEECGAPFTPRGCNRHKQRFCGKQCQVNAWQRNRYASDPEWRHARSEHNRAYHENLTGAAYQRRRLMMRRNKAMKRRRERSLRADPS